jgi:hypothetical protein
MLSNISTLFKHLHGAVATIVSAALPIENTIFQNFLLVAPPNPCVEQRNIEENTARIRRETQAAKQAATQALMEEKIKRLTAEITASKQETQAAVDQAQAADERAHVAEGKVRDFDVIHSND